MIDMSSSTGVLTQDLQDMAAFLTDVLDLQRISQTFSTQNYQKAIEKETCESPGFALEGLCGQLTRWNRVKMIFMEK